MTIVLVVLKIHMVIRNLVLVSNSLNVEATKTNWPSKSLIEYYASTQCGGYAAQNAATAALVANYLEFPFYWFYIFLALQYFYSTTK